MSGGSWGFIIKPEWLESAQESTRLYKLQQSTLRPKITQNQIPIRPAQEELPASHIRVFGGDLRAGTTKEAAAPPRGVTTPGRQEQTNTALIIRDKESQQDAESTPNRPHKDPAAADTES